MTRNAKVEPMKWKEFKEEWKKLDKNRKREIVAFSCGLLASALFVIMGCDQMLNNMEMIPSEHKYAIGGAFIASVGFFLFFYFCWEYYGRRFARIEDRIEKLEDKHAQEEEKCENNRA